MKTTHVYALVITALLSTTVLGQTAKVSHTDLEPKFSDGSTTVKTKTIRSGIKPLRKGLEHHKDLHEQLMSKKRDLLGSIRVINNILTKAGRSDLSKNEEKAIMNALNSVQSTADTIASAAQNLQNSLGTTKTRSKTS